MGTSSSVGRCKLTGSVSKYVKSHLIPEALTKLSTTGERMIEAGLGMSSIRRPTSWYDRSLVGRAGEDILARIDSRAIEELRNHRLVWSSWGGAHELPANDLVVEGGIPMLRWIPISDPKPLRLFYLSLAWRAGATTRPEFKFTPMESAVVEDLRIRVANEDPGSAEHYPIQLYQVVTRGTAHNRTPLLERKRLFNIDGLDPGEEVDYIRFYFDGLVAHVHLARQTPLPQHYLHYSCLGFQDRTPVFAHRYETSRASKDIIEIVRAANKPSSTRKPIATALDNVWRKSDP